MVSLRKTTVPLASVLYLDNAIMESPSNIMKRLILSFAFTCATLSVMGAELEWLTDLPAAKAKAQRENKFVLLDFTGSDWCGWCMKLKKEVFDQPEFAAFANANLIMVEVDFPRHTSLAPAQQQANERLARTYNIEGYPTIILLKPNGQFAGQTGYLAGGPKAYAANLEKITGLKHMDLAAAAKPAEPDQPEAPRKPVVFVPVAPAVPNHYDALALKGISGPKDRRLAIINNETFMVGDTAKVRVQDTRIEVVCQGIREDSVLITADGKQMELKLKH
ncbi:MAG: trxA [Pedosphaera sp.]|nr:trxA [Pedosphaera sp.]